MNAFSISRIVDEEMGTWLERVDGTRLRNELVCDLKNDLDSKSFLGWRL